MSIVHENGFLCNYLNGLIRVSKRPGQWSRILLAVALLSVEGGCVDAEIPVVYRQTAMTVGSEVNCENSALRMEEGPMLRHSPKGDWQVQHAVSRWPEQGETMQGMGVAVVDISGDGILDILLPNFGADQIYVGQADGTYIDETAVRWPADATDPTEAFSAADVDGDGDLDIFSSNRGGENALYINDGVGYFTKSTDNGLIGAVYGSVGAVFGDLDRDGDLDMMVNNHLATEYPGSTEEGDPNTLYYNNGDGTFEDKTALIPAALNSGFSYMSTIVDVTGDHYPDIYITNDFGFTARPNQLFVNPGIVASSYIDRAKELDVNVSIGGMGLGIGEINGDGVADFLLTNWGPINLLESIGLTGWILTNDARGIEWKHDDGAYSSWATDLQDLDNDGDLDFLAASGELMEPNGVAANPGDQPDGLFLRDGDVFVESGEAWGMHEDIGNTRGVVIVDLNGDGFLDMVKRDLRADAHIWLARCDDNHWTSITLKDESPNGFAVGARVKVTAGGNTQYRWVGSTGRGFATSGSHTVHFGLGEETQIDAIEVQWPNGGVSNHAAVVADAPIRIERTFVK
jgi:hypothetical protein